MVQRDPSPRGDKNGADINLALDALEMAFTHDHINAFAIVSGDSDFIALVNKLKQYNKIIFVVGGRAFTSTILQKNCHEFVSYESLLDEPQRPQRSQREHQPSQHGGQPSSQPHRGPNRRPAPLDLALSMPLVERALQVLERREVRPQLGLLKSTMLQLDSTFNEKAYGSGSFSDFVEKLKRNGMVNVTGGEGRYMISRKDSAEQPEKAAAKPEEAIPILRDVLESHRIEMDEGCTDDTLVEWVKSEQPNFDWKRYGFQEFSEFLNYAQDKALVRVEPQEEKLLVRLGPEFHPPAVPEPEPAPAFEEQPEDDEPQPVVAGQPTARSPKPKKSPRKKAEGEAPPRTTRPRRPPRKKPTE